VSFNLDSRARFRNNPGVLAEIEKNITKQVNDKQNPPIIKLLLFFSFSQC